MNGNDRFLNVNDAHLRVTGGNVHASSFNLDQISITTTSTTASTIDFLNETKAFNTRSNIEVGTANLFVDTTTSNVGIHTSSPEYALDVHGPANVSVLTAASNVGILTTSPEYALDVHGTANVGVLTANTITGSGGTLLLGSHLLPTQHQQFDIGSAEKKIRHLYLSNNSLWIGDDSKISVVDGKMKFLKRNKNIVPSGTEALGGNATDAIAHAGVPAITDMKLEHWLAYTKSLEGGEGKDIKDIFTTATSNYESVTASEAFKEYDDTNIYSLNKLRLGSAAAADATLDVVGTIKATSDLTVNTNTFHVDATNSRVGVGTLSPQNMLHVYKANNDETSGILIEKASGQNPTSAALFFGVASTTETNNRGIPKAAIFYERNLVNGRGDLKFCNDETDDTNPVSTTASDTRMIIKNNGNIGIGTTTPNQKLSIYTGSTSTPALSFDRYSSGNYRTDIYQNSYGPDFRVGYGDYEPESILYLKRFSDGSKETQISDNLLLRHRGGDSGNGRGYIELKFNNNGPNQGSGAGLILASDEAGAFQPLAILDTWKSGVSAAPNMVFRTRGTERMRITDDGDVSIGTTDASSKLYVKDDTTYQLHLEQSFGGGGNIQFGNSNHIVGRGAGKTNFTDGNDTVLSTAGSGASGVGTSGGSYYIKMTWNNEALSSDGTPFGLSDERIKKDITDIEDTYALQKIREIKPRLYTYKSHQKHNQTVFGFIAQEVRETLPYSTTIGTECIPNIQDYATFSNLNSNVITFTNFNTSDLDSNSNTIRVFHDDLEGREEYSNTISTVNVTRVIDDHAIEIDTDLLINEIFVYGQQVEDFHFLKKEHIFTVATAALQEVDRQLQAEKSKVATLETQLVSVLARLDALESA
tara:strand:+ start:1140 stop:3752 length:2613 start_codon:yes stop_codon:yes gene_type:complete